MTEPVKMSKGEYKVSADAARAFGKEALERLNECTPDPSACGCLGHKMPGVHHVRACCDEPHITQEEFEAGR